MKIVKYSEGSSFQMKREARKLFHFLQCSLLIAVMGIFLSGCMVGPDFRKPEAPSVMDYTSTALPRETAGANVSGGAAQYFAGGQKRGRGQKRHLDDVGIGNSGIIDRFWFHSLYFRDPDGNLLEVATKGPGYTADESRETLGSRLVLPKWVEPRRTEIEAFLRKTDAGNPVSWPPVYPLTPKRPEALTQSN